MTFDTAEDEICVLDEGFYEARTTVCIGATASLQVVRNAPTCPDILCRALGSPLTWQLRNSTSVKEAILSPILAPQMNAALLAMGARVKFDETEGLLVDYLSHSSPLHGMLFALLVPLNNPGRVWGDSRVAYLPASEPIVSAVAVLDITDGNIHRARLALTGAWRQNARLTQAAERMVGYRLSQEIIQKTAAAVKQEVDPQDDYRGSAEYRREMASTLSRRALEQCLKETGQL